MRSKILMMVTVNGKVEKFNKVIKLKAANVTKILLNIKITKTNYHARLFIRIAAAAEAAAISLVTPAFIHTVFVEFTALAEGK